MLHKDTIENTGFRFLEEIELAAVNGGYGPTGLEAPTKDGEGGQPIPGEEQSWSEWLYDIGESVWDTFFGDDEGAGSNDGNGDNSEQHQQNLDAAGELNRNCIDSGGDSSVTITTGSENDSGEGSVGLRGLQAGGEGSSSSNNTTINVQCTQPEG
ncbi:MAG: hypothetical protein ABJN35_11160 [Erythrobacter sp.]